MAAAKTSCPGASRKPCRKVSRNVTRGHVYIKSTFNNIIVFLTDMAGTVVAWTSSGQVGFKGSRRFTLFAVQLTVEVAACHAQEHGMKKVGAFVKDPGSGRETVIRFLRAIGLEVGLTQDVTPQAHNGARPLKRRRV